MKSVYAAYLDVQESQVVLVFLYSQWGQCLPVDQDCQLAIHLALVGQQFLEVLSYQHYLKKT